MLVASPSNLGAIPATGRPAVPSPAFFFLAEPEKEGARLLSMPPTAMAAEGERDQESVLVGVDGWEGDGWEGDV